MTDAPNRLVCSAKLPARANLEHLKNEARQRLNNMRSQRSAARLSEAQLLVARSYGFPSWRKLKSYVEALNDFGQELIDAVRAGNLQTIRKLLDNHPELVNASTDVHLRVRPNDALTMRLVHLAIARTQGIGGYFDGVPRPDWDCRETLSLEWTRSELGRRFLSNRSYAARHRLERQGFTAATSPSVDWSNGSEFLRFCLL